MGIITIIISKYSVSCPWAVGVASTMQSLSSKGCEDIDTSQGE